MIKKQLYNLKFILSKINVLFRYKIKKIKYALNWIFFGKDISNLYVKLKIIMKLYILPK